MYMYHGEQECEHPQYGYNGGPGQKTRRPRRPVDGHTDGSEQKTWRHHRPVDDREMETFQSRHKNQLCKWIGGGRDFTLLYQATRDGCDGQTFHQMCDNKGPTVTVLYNTASFVFGGYTSQSWKAADTDQTICNLYDSNAFIFRLVASSRFKPKIYPLKKGCEDEATDQTFNQGPTFGGDLMSFSGTIKKQNNYFQGNETGTLGSQYHMKGDNAAAFCGRNYKYTEIEVYQVTDMKHKGTDRGEGPWRKMPQSDCKTLMTHMERYSPPEGSKVKAINFLLMGSVGAGKSSFFNSVNSVFQREITALARSGSADRSLTTTYRRYRVRSSETGEALKLRICDTRGLEDEGGLDLVDLIAVIEGHVPDRFQFNPTVPISADSTGYNSSPTTDDKIHCVAFVIDGTTVDVFPDKIVQVFKALQQRLNPKGIPQVVIVTKTDKVCSDVQEDVGQMFNSASIADLVDQAGQLLGLQRSCVFPVKNYEEEMGVDEKVDLPILLCLKQVLRYAEDYIQDSDASD